MSLRDRFMAKIQEDESTGCWEWMGSGNGRGYGQIRVGRTMRRAHRVSYELFCEPVPDGMLVCHSCDNPGCVNPEHLFLGTQCDNMADMRSKGRDGGRAKLSKADVLAIRAASGLTQRELGERFGVTQQQISNIRVGL